MESVSDAIKQKIDIIEFLSTYITLKKTGRNFKAVCPFHQEKTPSFVVSPERQIWHCFGACQEGGDIFRFLMKWENITFSEALKELAQKAGVKLQKFDYEDAVWKKKERLISLNTTAAEYFSYLLTNSSYGKTAREYLASRKINAKIIKTFGLGYAPRSWESLLHFLKKKKYGVEEMFEAGLLVKGERGTFYDRFRGRLVFPIRDSRGNVIGFSGRSLMNADKSAKYINTPETPIYHKRETLYGIDLAKDVIKKENNAILVEGEFDVISPFQAGFENFVAIKGSAVTREQLIYLKRYTSKITLALDADEAGQEAIKRGIEEAERIELEVGIIHFDFAKDPDEAVSKDIQAFKNIVKKPIPIYDFIIESSIKKHPGDDSFSKKELADEILPYIEKIQNPIIQSHYMRKVSGLLDVSESSIELFFRKMKGKRLQQKVYKPLTQPISKPERELTIQKYLLSTLFQNKNPYVISDRLFSIVRQEDFSIPSYRKILHAFFDYKKEHKGEFDMEKFSSALPKELLSVFDELFLFASSEILEEQRNLEKLAYELKKMSLKKMMAEKLQANETMSKVEEDDLKALNVCLKEVEKKLSSL